MVETTGGADPGRYDEVLASFRAMPRWRRDGTAWLDALPRLVARQCRIFGVRPDGQAAHGSNALVVPVRRGDRSFAMRLLSPADDGAADAAALEYWDGRGTVRLIDFDRANNALLIERLTAGRSLRAEPLSVAVPSIARILRATAVRPPPQARSTEAIVARLTWELADEWPTLGAPGGSALFEEVLAAARTLPAPAQPTAVNGDLHYDNVLAGERAPWLVVDPVLLAGDSAYAVAGLLWTRLDEMPAASDIHHWFDVITREACLDREIARKWVLLRAADYLVWGLRHGLTEDPARCLRIIRAFV